MKVNETELKGLSEQNRGLKFLLTLSHMIRAINDYRRSIKPIVSMHNRIDITRLWAASNVDKRALIEEFTTIQHYIGGDRESFMKSIRISRSFEGNELGCASRTGLLLDIIEANQLIRNGEIKLAIDCYKRRIRIEVKTYNRLRRKRKHFSIHALSHQSEILGLLEVNLADLISRDNKNISEAESHYKKACSYMPDNSFLKDSLAEFYRSQKRWAEAIEQYKNAFTAGQGIDRDSKQLNINLANIYLEWADDLNTPAIPTSLNSDSEYTDNVNQTLGLVETSSGLKNDTGTKAALNCLGIALSTLEWLGITDWEGKTHYQRASLLEELGQFTEASDEYLESSECYRKSDDFQSSTYVLMKRGDLLYKTGSFNEGKESYRSALKQSDSIKDSQSRVERSDELIARLSIVDLSEGLSFRSHRELIKRWRDENHFGTDTWGPYFDVLSQTSAMFEKPEIRLPVNVYYHHLLRENDDPVSARDLTTALFKLYEFERKTPRIFPDDKNIINDSASFADPMNVVNPIAVEISESFTNRIVVDDSTAKTFGNQIRNSIQEDYGVRIPGIRVMSKSELLDNQYVILIHEVRLTRGTIIGNDVSQVFHQLEKLIVTNLVEFVGHQEVQNYLERNLLVQPTVEDVSDKENCHHMDPLCKVFRALVAERVPLMGSWKFSEADIRNVSSVVMKLKQKSDEVSKFLESCLSDTTLKALNEFSDHKLPDNILRNAIVNDLNNIIDNQEVFDENRFTNIELRPETQKILKQEDNVTDLRILNRLLLEDAYPEELVKGPLTYPRELYQTFRIGWEKGLSLMEIVENIRRIPLVRNRLWGKDNSYKYLFLDQSFELWIDSCLRLSGDFHFLVIDPKQLHFVIETLRNKLLVYLKPALVVRRQDQRALVRQMITATFPEVPVLSIHELQPGESRISDILNISINP